MCNAGVETGAQMATNRVTHTFGIIEGMDDAIPTRPDHHCLFDIASEQHGLFTSSQARSCGFSWERLSDATRRGRFMRIYRGLYRLRDYPSSPLEGIAAGWLAVGKETAVVSHESALEILDLSDVIPHAVHLTVPRSRRHLPKLPGVTIHTTTRELVPSDIITRDGIRLTSVARTILDAAEWGSAPEQIELAIWQAVRRSLLLPDQLRVAAGQRSRRVSDLVASGLAM
jgi:predicted transcriptional regulator of viral defense system